MHMFKKSPQNDGLLILALICVFVNFCDYAYYLKTAPVNNAHLAQQTGTHG